MTEKALKGRIRRAAKRYGYKVNYREPDGWTIPLATGITCVSRDHYETYGFLLCLQKLSHLLSPSR
ncbi:hypothetical protein [Limnoglobus roseus]|uniref:Uncharacterized protein n=1 Tax=Limnoglobus roseus TaxID=2598579 RepID=A0A5C1AE56_9BACT|nr:hypothetical protein [Limnoglobus roseus]QEL16533.1 hypothetical protein PX52LOC_03492 [Limnoglobus roseus]